LLTSGCSLLNPFAGSEVKKLEVQTKAVERTRLNLKEPSPIQLRTMDWIIITPDNVEEVWAKLKESGSDVVIIGLTDEGYESLAITIAEIRNYIAQQRTIIIKYKEYYEPEPTKDSTSK
jgi:hypothetical protein